MSIIGDIHDRMVDEAKYERLKQFDAALAGDGTAEEKLEQVKRVVEDMRKAWL